MPKGRVPLPHVDYAENYVRIRVLHPDECQQDSFRTIDPGRTGHTQIVICKRKGETTTSNQSLRIENMDWENDEDARNALKKAFDLVRRKYGKIKMCVDGLSEEDKKRFPEFICK